MNVNLPAPIGVKSDFASIKEINIAVSTADIAPRVIYISITRIGTPLIIVSETLKRFA